MAYLIDTNIIARVTDSTHADYLVCAGAILRIRQLGEDTVTSIQNVCEVWNLFTRPAQARGGFGLQDHEAELRLRIIERMFEIVADPPGLYDEWRDLVLSLHVRGKQTHDARIAAWMRLHGVANALTFNTQDFARYGGIVAVDPLSVP